ncbi:putative membrane protein [Clostridium sporogenes]|uniref:Putative membrane protein n=1 Tax=Clostridium sporogenes TaxID=1509 RepID=A0A1J1D288_CLOSG|nr:putative membrane protein [Clostridium sporogenes]APH14395.1 putative membrane protein [Clostridium sporogenes]
MTKLEIILFITAVVSVITTMVLYKENTKNK